MSQSTYGSMREIILRLQTGLPMIQCSSDFSDQKKRPTLRSSSMTPLNSQIVLPFIGSQIRNSKQKPVDFLEPLGCHIQKATMRDWYALA